MQSRHLPLLLVLATSTTPPTLALRPHTRVHPQRKAKQLTSYRQLARSLGVATVGVGCGVLLAYLLQVAPKDAQLAQAATAQDVLKQQLEEAQIAQNEAHSIELAQAAAAQDMLKQQLASLQEEKNKLQRQLNSSKREREQELEVENQELEEEVAKLKKKLYAIESSWLGTATDIMISEDTIIQVYKTVYDKWFTEYLEELDQQYIEGQKMYLDFLQKAWDIVSKKTEKMIYGELPSGDTYPALKSHVRTQQIKLLKSIHAKEYLDASHQACLEVMQDHIKTDEYLKAHHETFEEFAQLCIDLCWIMHWNMQAPDYCFEFEFKLPDGQDITKEAFEDPVRFNGEDDQQAFKSYFQQHPEQQYYLLWPSLVRVDMKVQQEEKQAQQAKEYLRMRLYKKA